jgi:hypothetical protein
VVKLLRPVKELRQAYSLQLNRGRELLARHVERAHDFTELVADAERWDRENVLLVQTTFRGEAPDYSTLPPVNTHGSIEQDLHALRRDVTANLNQLDAIENSLGAAKSGCAGALLLGLPPLLAALASQAPG